jgi:uncharacterized protein YajQ (UPF0234 family)
MTEALQRQLRSENDQLRKQVNTLHEKLFKVKNQNKLLKTQGGNQELAELQQQVQKLSQAVQRERTEKDALKIKLIRKSSPKLSYNLT